MPPSRISTSALRQISANVIELGHFFLRLGRSIQRFDCRLRYNGRPDDIFIVSYPKSGTTWMQAIVWEMINPEVEFWHISVAIPYLEMDLMGPNDKFEEMPSPRIMKTHLRKKHTPIGGGKYIYVARNPADVAVSYYHHHVRYCDYKDDIETFIKEFFQDSKTIIGRDLWGTWFSHVAGWSRGTLPENLLVLKYEDLHAHFDREISKVAAFLGIQLTDERLADIRRKCSFAYMKENVGRFEMVRNGAVGDGAKYMSEEIRSLCFRKARPYVGALLIKDYEQTWLAADC